MRQQKLEEALAAVLESTETLQKHLENGVPINWGIMLELQREVCKEALDAGVAKSVDAVGLGSGSIP